MPMPPDPAPRRRPSPPAERVRAHLAALAGPTLAQAMPAGYQRVGRVLLVRLPGALGPYAREIGAAWQKELGVETVLRVLGPVEGELRIPQVERIAGEATETEVLEHGVRWRFDAARLMFAAGNRVERVRAGRLVRPGETVFDLFAGVGYFAIPAARAGAGRVIAVEKNPVAARYLRENLGTNGVASTVEVQEGDNRAVPLPLGAADRVFLGYLPSALPWVPRALTLVSPEGGWLHVHTVADARDAVPAATRAVLAALQDAGGTSLGTPSAREVKPYGPGRTHVVVDVRARPVP